MRLDLHAFEVRALGVNAMTLWRMVFRATRSKSTQ